MDPCECIMNHEMAMRRLLSFLRQSQSECTDVECFNESSMSANPMADSSNMMIFAMIWFVLAMLLYFFRPNSMRNYEKPKPTNNGPDNNGPSPGTAEMH
ncbi:uncharacterized protein C34C12.4 isoform X2 [Nilaparvata lugens]|nr:uncharacterized protein C34C12.4 isoform X2 [Nilaparvata lugens]